MPTTYVTPDGTRHQSCPRSFRLADGTQPTNVTPATFGRYPGCTIDVTPDTPAPTAAEQLAAEYAGVRAEHAAGLAAFRGAFLAVAGALAAAGVALPDPLTFRDMLGTMAALPGDEWTRAALSLRVAYDEVVFACGDMQMAYRLLPLILADTALEEG